MCVGTDPRGSCWTDVFQRARSPLLPSPAPANEPTVEVNAYSLPAIVNAVDAGAAAAPAGSARAAIPRTRGSEERAEAFMGRLLPIARLGADPPPSATSGVRPPTGPNRTGASR